MAFVPAEFMFVDHEENHPSSTSRYVLSSSCAPQDYFNGVSVPLLMRRSMSFSGVERCEEEEVHGDDVSDDGSQLLGEKKIKRLNMEQVKALEKSFELGNKLEPERKMHLARALGLEPRQVAIWFQNRRARWKTKQLEKDYGLLKRNYELLKAENDALQVHNKKLHTQLMVLKGRESRDDQSGPINLNKETKGFWNNVNASDVNLGGATKTTPETETETDSPLYSHPDNKHMFMSTSPAAKSTSVITQLLPKTSTTTSDHQSQKIDQMVPADENFCNMFTSGGGIDYQPGFWPWPEQQHFH